MSPAATRIEEEGVYIDPFKLVEGGRFREEAVRALLTEGPYPARDPAQNIADLKAQVSANAKGVAELRKLVAHYGLDVVAAYMGHIQDNAAESVARIVAALEPGASRSRPTRRAHQSRDPRRPRSPPRNHRLHRHERAADGQFQRAGTDHARLRALRVPHADRRRHPAQCRLPQADRHRRAGRFDARAELSRRGRRRQCRDEPDHRELPLWRAWALRLRAGHDEQSELRQ